MLYLARCKSAITVDVRGEQSPKSERVIDCSSFFQGAEPPEDFGFTLFRATRYS